MQHVHAMGRIVGVVGALAIGALSACNSADEPSATIVSMAVTVQNETVTIESDSTITGSLTVSGGEPLTTAFFDATGAAVIVPGAEFTLGVAPADTSLLNYTPVSPFEGVLEGRIAGPTTMDISVIDVLNDLIVFGPFRVSVTVQ